MVLNGAYFLPETDSPEDKDAAERATLFDYGWFGHPVFHESHDYPQIMKDRIQERSKQEGRTISRLPEFTAQQKEQLNSK